MCHLAAEGVAYCNLLPRESCPSWTKILKNETTTVIASFHFPSLEEREGEV